MILLEGGGLPVMNPDLGLIFWTSVIFLLAWFVIGRLGFKPISKALGEREASIEEALKAAEEARQLAEEMKKEREEMQKQMQTERAQMIAETKQREEALLKEAQEKANEQYQTKMEMAKAELDRREREMLTNVKNEVGTIALQIAEKVLRKELAGQAEQKTYVNNLVDEFKMGQN